MSFYIRIVGKYVLHKMLFYEEGTYVLQVGLELATKGRGWVAIDKQFLNWTMPQGEPISEAKRSEIMQRIDEWAQRNNTAIIISRALTSEEIDILNSGGKLPKIPNTILGQKPNP